MSAAGSTTRPKLPRLTPAQRERVRELMIDEGLTQAAAAAWVMTFAPEETRS